MRTSLPIYVPLYRCTVLPMYCFPTLLIYCSALRYCWSTALLIFVLTSFPVALRSWELHSVLKPCASRTVHKKQPARDCKEHERQDWRCTRFRTLGRHLPSLPKPSRGCTVRGAVDVTRAWEQSPNPFGPWSETGNILHMTSQVDNRIKRHNNVSSLIVVVEPSQPWGVLAERWRSLEPRFKRWTWLELGEKWRVAKR